VKAVFVHDRGHRLHGAENPFAFFNTLGRFCHDRELEPQGLERRASPRGVTGIVGPALIHRLVLPWEPRRCGGGDTARRCSYLRLLDRL
jgi:hypothetical protein